VGLGSAEEPRMTVGVARHELITLMRAPIRMHSSVKFI
jgi:hypothetical protein